MSGSVFPLSSITFALYCAYKVLSAANLSVTTASVNIGESSALASDQYPNALPDFSTPSVSFLSSTYFTASEIFAPISTCFLTAATVLPAFSPPLKSNVTNLYPVSGSVFPLSSITFSPYLAVNVVFVTIPSFLARTFLPSSPLLSIQATKFFVSSFGVGAVGSATVGVATFAWSQVKSFLTS